VSLFDYLYQLELFMTTVQDLLNAAGNEASEVKARIDELEAKVQQLQDQIANGTPVTEAEMQSVKDAIHNIFTPS